MSDEIAFKFPVYIHDGSTELPQRGNYYVVAANGFWIHRDGVSRGFVPVKDIPFLLPLKEEIAVDLPMLGAKYVWQIKKFFQDVVVKYHTEAATTLFFNRQLNVLIAAPTLQTTTGASVIYLRRHAELLARGYLRAGTIHSHCDFSAFHSGVDVHDEEDFDGLHCTFGHNDREEFTITASWVVNGVRKTIDPLTVLEGLVHVEGKTYTLLPVDEATQEEWLAESVDWIKDVQVRGGEHA